MRSTTYRRRRLLRARPRRRCRLPCRCRLSSRCRRRQCFPDLAARDLLLLLPLLFLHRIGPQLRAFPQLLPRRVQLPRILGLLDRLQPRVDLIPRQHPVCTRRLVVVVVVFAAVAVGVGVVEGGVADGTAAALQPFAQVLQHCVLHLPALLLLRLRLLILRPADTVRYGSPVRVRSVGARGAALRALRALGALVGARAGEVGAPLHGGGGNLGLAAVLVVP